MQWDHTDLVANLMPVSDQYKEEHTDEFGHGTHIAGIIGAASIGGCLPACRHRAAMPLGPWQQ